MIWLCGFVGLESRLSKRSTGSEIRSTGSLCVFGLLPVSVQCKRDSPLPGMSWLLGFQYRAAKSQPSPLNASYQIATDSLSCDLVSRDGNERRSRGLFSQAPRRRCAGPQRPPAVHGSHRCKHQCSKMHGARSFPNRTRFAGLHSGDGGQGVRTGVTTKHFDEGIPTAD